MSITTDVLIVGAGPVGLTAAVVLTQEGYRVTVVDKQAEGVNESRAAVIHARALELLEPYGVAEPMVARGVRTPRFTVRDRDRILVPVPFDGLPTRYPYSLMLAQSETEAFLLARLKELGGSVCRPLALTGIEQNANGVVATFDDGSKQCADYLIGADGKDSTVRELVGIGFPGGVHPLSFSLIDVELTGTIPKNEAILYCSSAGLVAVAPLPDGQHRIVAAVDEAPRDPDIWYAQHLLDTRGPLRESVIVQRKIRGSRYRAQHRVADSFRERRVLLAGDAAHVHSPVDGQGMNLGIEDAVLLGEALAHVLDGGSAALLDDYAATRRAVGRRMVDRVGRLTAFADIGPTRRQLRNLVLGIAGRLPAVQYGAARYLAGLDRGTATAHAVFTVST